MNKTPINNLQNTARINQTYTIAVSIYNNEQNTTRMYKTCIIDKEHLKYVTIRNNIRNVNILQYKIT